MTDSIDRLYQAVVAAKHADPASSRTARLLRSGRSKMAKKLAEEAIEVVIDVIDGNTDAAIKESADLIYNLVALWVEAGIEPAPCLGRDGAARAAVRHRREAAQARRRARVAPQGGGARKPPRPQAPLIPNRQALSFSVVPAESASQTSAWTPPPGHSGPRWLATRHASQPLRLVPSPPPRNRTRPGSWPRCRSWKARSFRCRPTSCSFP